MKTVTKCNACGDEFPQEYIADKSVVNTGGDTICACCHLECVPNDADVIEGQAKNQQQWMADNNMPPHTYTAD